MFPPKKQRTFVSKLSGGERRRLYLLTVLIKNPNFLILDEPTNDLDLITLNKLEEFLESFKGCVILVSHDRYFMDKLVDQLFVFEGEGKIKGFVGTYSEYRDAKQALERKEKKVSAKSDTPSKKIEKPAQKRKISYQEKQEYQTLESEIDLLEQEKSKLEVDIGASSDDLDKLQQLSERYGTVMSEIDKKSYRWMVLDELFS